MKNFLLTFSFLTVTSITSLWSVESKADRLCVATCDTFWENGKCHAPKGRGNDPCVYVGESTTCGEYASKIGVVLPGQSSDNAKAKCEKRQ